MEHMPVSAAFVGRQRELSQLQAQYEEAVSGCVRFSLLAGEPGAGKTRLISEFTQLAASRGAIILRGGASEAEGMPPYLPFLEALGGYIKAAPVDKLREDVGELAPTLAAILPELTSRLGGAGRGYPLPAEQGRLRLFQAVGDFLTAISHRAPVVLVLDDLHWTDPSSLDLLSYIVRYADTARLLLLGSYRPGDADYNPALGRALLEWTRLRVLLTLSLSPLTRQEIAQLTEGYLDGPIEPHLAGFLHTQSEGNPFFTEELLRGWLDNGTLLLDKGLWTLNKSMPATSPSTIFAAIRGRLAHLPPAVLDDLHTAAIIGRTFEVEFLSLVLGLDPEAVEERILVAQRAGLLRADAGGIFSFSHDKIRECLYSEVSASRSRRLHGFIGRALETQFGDGAQRLVELAFHFARSGDHARGAAYSRQAAEHALSSYAPAEAVTHFQTAVALSNQDDPGYGSLLLGLGDACLLANDELTAIEAFQQLQEWFAHHSPDDTVLAALAAYGLGRARWRLEQSAAARKAFEQALSLLGDRPSPEAVSVLIDLSSLLTVSLGNYPQGVALAERALAIARSINNPRLEASAGRTLGNLLVRGARIAEGRALLEPSLELAVASNDPAEAAECCACLGMAYYWSGNIQEMHRLALQRIKYAQLSNEPYQLRHVYAWLAGIETLYGNFDEALRFVALAYASAERFASPEPLGFIQMGHGCMLHLKGEYDEAAQLMDKGIRTFRALGPGTLIWYLGWQGLNDLALGKRESAIAIMGEVESLLEGVSPGTMPQLEALSQIGLLAVALSDRESAGRYYTGLLAFEGLGTDFVVDRVLGELALLLGDIPSADRHLRAAAEQGRSAGRRPELALILIAQARLVWSYGTQRDRVEAGALLTEAISLTQSMGMIAAEQQARALLDALSTPPAVVQRTSPALPAGLSEREVEVLKLVVQGFSNRRIGEHLFLSEKTVANHLTNIYSKTNTDNRAAATAFALRHGIA